ncbi:MAG: flagellar filament capping protein FliD [Magnetospirillum sp.]|nr:flagellar filament capping protein FliD [Magnetospirillum sp.]
MSTNAVSALPSALAGLLKQYASTSQKSDGTNSGAAASSAPVAAGLSLGSDPAYSLSLGSAQSGSAMIGYTRLATLGAQVESDMKSVTSAAQSADSGGAGMVNVQVNQLAQSQQVVSSRFGDPDGVSLGTGTLSVQMGSIDPDTGEFTASGDPVDIAINGGSLNDIAQSINESGAGITAQVTESGGGYELEITGAQTGAKQAFSLSGLDDLNFDPSQPEQSALTQVSNALDAQYNADGIDFTFGSNTDVPVAFGTTATFTATGSLDVPRSSLPDTVQKMMGSFNSLQQAIAKMAGDKGELAGDVNLAAGMFKRIGDAATASYATGGDLSTLGDIGISVEKDGTLSIDQSVLASALSADPAAVQSLVAQAAKAMDDSIRPYLGNKGAISSQVAVLGSLLNHGASLLDYLNGGSASSGSSSSLTDYLNQSGGMAGNSSSLLSALN